jgi:hypothetical protein
MEFSSRLKQLRERVHELQAGCATDTRTPLSIVEAILALTPPNASTHETFNNNTPFPWYKWTDTRWDKWSK